MRSTLKGKVLEAENTSKEQLGFEQSETAKSLPFTLPHYLIPADGEQLFILVPEASVDVSLVINCLIGHRSFVGNIEWSALDSNKSILLLKS